ncbi:hypothetical protein B0H21DRAFT_739545 [Amylocystis lapponica]|nr:hypothetical protein B0H21DRAFT_739545 [Amylocystis lapponica]
MPSLFPSSSSTDPVLPPFRTLLLKGPYHTSAPFYFLLSHVAQNSSAKALMLTPSRQALMSASKQFSDEWLSAHGGEGRTCHWSSRVDILYPPTPAHLVLLLSMFHRHDGSYYHPTTTVDDAVSLIVLHEISSYFSEHTEATVSSYLSLISHALAVISSISVHPIALAVFESDLGRLRLPILRPVSPESLVPSGTPTERTSARRESMTAFVEKYFEWIGDVESEASVPPTPPDVTTLEPDGTRTMRMNLCRRQDPNDLRVWRWVEYSNGGRKGFSVVNCTDT